jgi:serine/threonine protein kinase
VTPPTGTRTSDPPIEKLGRYRISVELAAGGMSHVYLARAEGPGGFEKLVALKVIHRHLANHPDFVAMFLDEARIVSRIDHPNVCHVFDFGCDGGTYYLAMEYLVGEPLSRVVRAEHASRAPTPHLGALVAKVVADACEGLHAAHELRGSDGRPLEVVHRDISPHNLFVTFDGVCKVVDFGIARARDRVHDTTTGTVKGKFAYMAPEQLNGQVVDRRADVWSMGVVLFELLTGRRLFRRESDGATATAVLHSAIPRPSELRPGISPDLDRIVLTALEREPEKRFATTRELGRALLVHATVGGVQVGLADLSTWIEHLFPNGRSERASLATVATQIVERSALREGTRTASQRRRTKRTIAVVAMIATAAAGGLAAGVIGARGGNAREEAPPRAAVGEVGAHRAAIELAARSDAGAGDASRTALATNDAPDRERPSELANERETELADPEVEAVVRRAPPGTVQVATPGGWATVRLRGRVLGNTPLRAELPPGTHVLQVSPFGRGPTQRVSVRVRSGEVSRVRHPIAAP